MNIGVPKETAANERRVALTPEVAGRLAKSGWAVLVERGAGEAASFGDESYGTAGATLVAAADVFGQRDRKSTRLNSSHDQISYAVFCLKKKTASSTSRPTRPRPRCSSPHRLSTRWQTLSSRSA